MVTGRRCYLILCVFLLLLDSVFRSEAKRKLLGTLAVGNGVSWNFHEAVDFTVDELLIGCNKENITKEEAKHCESCLSSKILLKDYAKLLKKIKLQEAILDLLPPQAKLTLLDCLRKHHAQNNAVHSWTWFSKFSEFLFYGHIVSKRYIVCNPHASISKNLGLFRVRRLGDSNSAPNPLVERDGYIPSPNNKKRDRQKRVNIISTISATAVIILSPIIYLCCLKGKGSKVDTRQRDRQARLNACSYDISAGSSEISHALQNPNSDSRVSEIVGGHGTSVFLSQSAESTGGGVCRTGNLLPLPPGRIAQLLSAPPAPHNPPAPAPPPPPPLRPGKVPKSKPDCGHSPSGGGSDSLNHADFQKAKLKPFFWDKVMANPDSSMVWHELKDGSFQVDEEMMETLFGYPPEEKGKGSRMKESSSSGSPRQLIQIIDAKKSQNLAILLKALNVSIEEVCNALNEGNELPGELVNTLLKMAPTSDEELKLRLYNGDISHLGPAERFLKVMVDIPFAFRRLEALSFVSSLQEDVSSMKDAFSTLEAACDELKNSRLFLKLLEAVLKTGNRMNVGTYRGCAEAFKLDTLLKLSDVKGADGKTTLLHFVVEEIIRSEGVRSAKEIQTSEDNSTVDDSNNTEYYRSLGLEVVMGLSNNLMNVTKAAAIDGDNITATVSTLSQSLSKTKCFLRCEVASLEKENEFRKTLENFAESAEADIGEVEEEVKRIRSLVKDTVDYFHGGSRKEDGLRLFVTVRDFLLILEKVCKEVKSSTTATTLTRTPTGKQTPQKSIHSGPASPESRHSNNVANVRPLAFPRDDSSSDDHHDHDDHDHHDEELSP